MENDLVVLERFSACAEAEIVKSILQQNGIQAFVHDQHLVRLHGVAASIFGGVKVRVKASDVEESKRIISRVKVEAAETGEVHGIECPKCKSTKTEYEYQKQSSLGFITLFFQVVPHYRMKENWKCQSCNHEWTYKRGTVMDFMFSISVTLLFIMLVVVFVIRLFD